MTRDRRLPEPPPGVSRQSVEPWQDPAIAAGLAEWQRTVLGSTPSTPSPPRSSGCAAPPTTTAGSAGPCASRSTAAGPSTRTTAAVVARGDTESLAAGPAAAARLADAMMTQPAWIDDELVAELNRHFGREELLEMSLDVMKFSHQKIKVSLGLDEPMRADGGLVDFAVDADGHLSFGVPKRRVHQ